MNTRRDKVRDGLLDNPVFFSLLVVVLCGAIVVCLIVGYFCFEMGGPQRLLGHLRGLPTSISFDGRSFVGVRFWKGADGIQARDWVSPPQGALGERRIRLMWAERRERDTAADLLTWDIEQFHKNDNHQEGGEALESEVSATTACTSGRMDGEVFVSFVVCRDDCVPVCIELRERAVHGGCAPDDEPCLRRSACTDGFNRHGAMLASLNARLANAVGQPGMCR